MKFSFLLLCQFVLVYDIEADFTLTTPIFENSETTTSDGPSEYYRTTHLIDTTSMSAEFTGKLTQEENAKLQRTCGRYNPRTLQKSLNSEIAYRKHAPWAVALIKPPTEYRKEIVLYCSGILISQRHVLTARHCAKSFGSFIFCDDNCIEDMKCHLDESCSSKNVTVLRAKRVFGPILSVRHFLAGHSDIAIFELEKPVKQNSRIHPACLTGNNPAIRDVLEVYSYGSDNRPENSTLQSSMQHVSVTRVPCVELHTQDAVCFRSDNQGLAKGDSGGGSFTTIDDITYVTAVVSGQKPVTPNYHDYALTAVAPHLAWICNYTGISVDYSETPQIKVDIKTHSPS